MVVRVWIEGGTGGLRARVTQTADLEAPEEVTAVAGSVDEIVSIVRTWLLEFAAGPAPARP